MRSIEIFGFLLYQITFTSQFQRAFSPSSKSETFRGKKNHVSIATYILLLLFLMFIATDDDLNLSAPYNRKMPIIATGFCAGCYASASKVKVEKNKPT